MVLEGQNGKERGRSVGSKALIMWGLTAGSAVAAAAFAAAAATAAVLARSAALATASFAATSAFAASAAATFAAAANSCGDAASRPPEGESVMESTSKATQPTSGAEASPRTLVLGGGQGDDDEDKSPLVW